MTVRVYGKLNGTDIEFDYDAARDRWEVPAPGDEDGEYVVEVYAEDEAGNSAYKCTILFEVSGKKIRCKIIPHRYIVEDLKSNDMHTESKTNNYTVIPKR